MGFEHLLLVTGESAKVVDVKYIGKALEILRPYFSNLSIEVQPLKQQDYRELSPRDCIPSLFIRRPIIGKVTRNIIKKEKKEL